MINIYIKNKYFSSAISQQRRDGVVHPARREVPTRSGARAGQWQAPHQQHAKEAAAGAL